MSKPKKELFEFDKETSELLFDHCEYYENSVLLKFLNYKFNNKILNSNTVKELVSVFDYDQMLSQDTLIEAKHFHLLDDYESNLEQQITYFNLLQEEIRGIFIHLFSFKRDNKFLIPEGRFQVLENYMLGLGTLRYEIVFGKLHRKWDKNIKSFRQVLLRSMVTFFDGDESILKYLCICQNKLCEKIYFNKTGNSKFCIYDCGKNHHDTVRNNKDRYRRELADPDSARSRAIDKAAKEREANKNKVFRKKTNKLT